MLIKDENNATYHKIISCANPDIRFIVDNPGLES